jgi:hypothetical protein
LYFYAWRASGRGRAKFYYTTHPAKSQDGKLNKNSPSFLPKFVQYSILQFKKFFGIINTESEGMKKALRHKKNLLKIKKSA